jgi:hypothetical protein
MSLKTLAASGFFALVLLVVAPLDARNFSKSYSNSADRTFDAIMRLVQSDNRVHLIDYDGQQHLVHFRLALDPGDPNSPGDQFAGMYVLLQVSSDRQRVLVSLTADRIFPPETRRGNVRAEESTFAKDFWKQLDHVLKR